MAAECKALPAESVSCLLFRFCCSPAIAFNFTSGLPDEWNEILGLMDDTGKFCLVPHLGLLPKPDQGLWLRHGLVLLYLGSGIAV